MQIHDFRGDLPNISAEKQVLLQIRVIYHEVKAREAAIKAVNPASTAVDDFLRQIGYHEYSRYLSFHFPFTHERSLLEHVRAVPWANCPMRFKVR